MNRLFIVFIYLLGGFHQHQQNNPHSYTLNLAHHFALILCQFKSTKYEANNIYDKKHFEYKHQAHEWILWMKEPHTTKKSPVSFERTRTSRAEDNPQ